MKHLRLTAGALLVSTALSSVAHAATELAMWYHGAGNEVESAIVNQIIDDFNASQSEYTIALESFPQGAYNDAVQAAALAGWGPSYCTNDSCVLMRLFYDAYGVTSNSAIRLANDAPCISRSNRVPWTTGRGKLNLTTRTSGKS